jgi:GNAT superfamily N-acetyltransferase
MNIQLIPFDPASAGHVDSAVAIWNRACSPDLAISARFMRFNTGLPSGARQAGRLAAVAGEPVGFVLASRLTDDPTVAASDQGWLDAIAVDPTHQRAGVGSALLAWAEGWLADEGCRRLSLGGSLRPFTPGLPVTLGSEPFFRRHGFQAGDDATSWDVAANLAGYAAPAWLPQVDAVVRPGRVGDEAALLTCLRREFPGRWRYDCQEFLRSGGRISDYMLLWTERGVDGFCMLTFADSVLPLERFYPYRLPRPWGQLGTVGVSEECRGRGYGLAVVDAGLRRLHANGVNGCVIDWTAIVDFYGKFGFRPYREYRMLRKDLDRCRQE